MRYYSRYPSGMQQFFAAFFAFFGKDCRPPRILHGRLKNKEALACKGKRPPRKKQKNSPRVPFFLSRGKKIAPR